MATASEGGTTDIANRLLIVERTIAAHFPDGCCANVSWAMLLVLYAGRRDARGSMANNENFQATMKDAIRSWEHADLPIRLPAHVDASDLLTLTFRRSCPTGDHADPEQIYDWRGVIEREGAMIGGFAHRTGGCSID